DVLAGVLPHLVVADRLEVAPVDEVETELTRARRRQHADGNADEPERDRPAPDRTWGHAAVVPRAESPKTAAVSGFSGLRVVLPPFTQPIHGGDKPVDAVDILETRSARIC